MPKNNYFICIVKNRSEKMYIPDIDAYSFTGTAIILGYLLTNEFNIDEQAALGAWFNVIGDILASNSAWANVMQTRYSDSEADDSNKTDESDGLTTVNEALDKLKKKIAELEKKKSNQM